MRPAITFDRTSIPEALKGRRGQHLAHELSEHQDAAITVCIRPLFLRKTHETTVGRILPDKMPFKATKQIEPSLLEREFAALYSPNRATSYVPVVLGMITAYADVIL